jgi:hypothetical protein
MKKLLLDFSLMIIGSLMLVSLSGCYVKGQDDGYRKDRDQHEDKRGHDDNGHDHDNGDRHDDQDNHH